MALNNLRAIVILIVVAFHSVLAYLAWLGSTPFPFDRSPFQWRAFPIIDSHRWFGFDLICAWQDVYLMAMMFFLSALFAWPSLRRKGTSKFLTDRLLRLGVPFIFAIIIVMPIALYPVYAVTAVDPSLTAYAEHYLALPFWPNGPMWFLWQLLALSFLAAMLSRVAPGWVEHLATTSGASPRRFVIWLLGASILAYVPLALIFTPWLWAEHGPLGLQFSRPLLYCVLYCAGLGIGAHGLDRGLLASDGPLVRHWAVWFASALAAFLLWMGLTALAMGYVPTAPFAMQLVVDISFATACVCGCLFVLAFCLRFGAIQSPILNNLAENAFGIYLFHYPFVVWLQYALLPFAWPAIMKGTIVFAGATALAWAMAVATRLIPFGALLVGAERRLLATSPALQGQYSRAQPPLPHPRIVGR
ncbi:MAG TPA: acyltransferase [Acetobacteraceae bacterium]|jgi:peptidoglycan/LPS O-acetylase OafA/YrhL|nr:acyltransferase [Acetobacteraceae bacterium]